MKKARFFFLLFVLMINATSRAADTTDNQMEKFTKTQQSTSGEYEVTVNGRKIPVYTAKVEDEYGIYYFATFDFKGTADVTVTSNGDLSKAAILPAKYGYEPKLNGKHQLSFRARKPFRISIERDGRWVPLFLFGNRPEKAPKESDRVIYYGPGYHKVPITALHSGQTLYLAEGAVLNGGVYATGDNITIAGRGIIAGDGYEKFQGPITFPLYVKDCRNLKISGITITNSWLWTFCMQDCDNVEVDNLKICCSNILNDDAIDICNSSNVRIKNCFLRTQDDIFAIKGVDPIANRPCENIYIENCEAWTDRANIFRVGYECDAAHMSRIFAKDIDVLHYAKYFADPEEYWTNTIFWIQPSNNMMIEDCHFEDVRINASYNDIIVIEAKSCINTNFFYPNKIQYTEGGSARNITFKNIAVTGDESVFTGPNYIKGIDDEHYIKDIKIEGLQYFGREITVEQQK